MLERKLNWRPSLPDFRDFKLEAAAPTVTQPPQFSLRNNVHSIYDQGQTGSCTGNASALALRLTQIKEGQPEGDPSRLFIYYNERMIEGDPYADNGANLRDAMKVLAQYGAAPESVWPFNPYYLLSKPSNAAYQDAVQQMVKTYVSVNQTLIDLKQNLLNGLPFVFGFSVYESFDSPAVASTGVVPMPATTEKQLGGHAVCTVGYDDDSKTFEVANSWGAAWGDKGFFHMPYDYILNADLASDFWTISELETQNDPTRKWAVP